MPIIFSKKPLFFLLLFLFPLSLGAQNPVDPRSDYRIEGEDYFCPGAIWSRELAELKFGKVRRTEKVLAEMEKDGIFYLRDKKGRRVLPGELVYFEDITFGVTEGKPGKIWMLSLRGPKYRTVRGLAAGDTLDRLNALYPVR